MVREASANTAATETCYIKRY